MSGRILLTGLLLLAIGQWYSPVSAEPIDPSTLSWSVASLIDQSREPFYEPVPSNVPGQFYTPRDIRGLAISPDGRYLYAGYNNSIVYNNGGVPTTDRNGEVRRIDLTVTGPTMFDDQFTSRVLGQRGKALAVDDVGRVYMAETNRIDIYSADLSTKLFTISGLPSAEGLAVTREIIGGTEQLVLYNSDRVAGTLSKRILTEAGAGISAAALDTTFDGDGHLILAPGSASLRNVEIDPLTGNVFVAGRNNNRLYRVTPDGLDVKNATITNPFDIAFNGDQILVTHQNQRRVSIFTLAQFESNTIPGLGASFEPPWAELYLDPDGNLESNDPGLLSGIVVLPGVGIYLANENGQTEGQRSRYGVTDAFSGMAGNVFYQDLYFDDNDPILFAALPIPEPAAIFLALTAFAAFFGYARRNNRPA